MLHDLWSARDIVRVFVGRDLQLRYRQAVLGVLWVLILPLATVALLTLVFSRIQERTSSVPYPVFALAGMLIWLYFSSAVSRGSEVLVENPSLITKVWFPRVTAPAAALVSPLLDLAIGVVLLVVLQLALGVPVRWTIVLLPAAVGLTMLVGFGLVLILSAFNVRYRDVRHAIGPAMQILFFATPVAYSLDVVPSWARALVALNPLTGIIELVRWAVLGMAFDALHLFFAVGFAIVLVALGALYFRRAERTFADVI